MAARWARRTLASDCARARRAQPGAREKIPGSRSNASVRKHIMDVEHINAIGNNLADLKQRTLDLRGYL
jgi:hypothetical protein